MHSSDTLLASIATLLRVSPPSQTPRQLSTAHGVSCHQVALADETLFVKSGALAHLSQFQAEADGLEELRATQTVHVPRVIAIGGEQIALLILEWLDLRSASATSDAILGEQLARLHAIKRPQFGWMKNNFIGAMLQSNVWCDDWLHFWRTHRMGTQLERAARNGANPRFIERATLLNTLIDAFFVSGQLIASTLHGDLWNGNCGADAKGQPVVFDPAVYFGDRVADIAMTQLFGGFSAHFYAAYESIWPLTQEERARIDLYNLYHIVNHYNIFGGGYLQQASTIVEKLLAELKH